MRLRCTLLSLTFMTGMTASAEAHAPHAVAPGETLSGIAVAHGVSLPSLAAANGMSTDAFVIAGRTLTIPIGGTALASSTAPGSPAPAPIGGYRVRLGDTLGKVAAEHGVSIAAMAAANGLDPNGILVAGTSLRLPAAGTTPTASSTAPASTSTTSGTTGGHLVIPGETLSGIAAANGIANAALAAANGLRPDSFVIAGTRLRIPAATGTAATPVSSAPTAPIVPASGGRMNAGQISSIATQHGVPGSLAAAVAWQESGFNNGAVSVANARGIMQVIPSTWSFIENELGAGRLDPASPSDNVRAGSMLLNHLLRQTGGDEATAIAAYYQGLGSVRRIGMLPETRQYVSNVQALKGRFGG